MLFGKSHIPHNKKGFEVIKKKIVFKGLKKIYMSKSLKEFKTALVSIAGKVKKYSDRRRVYLWNFHFNPCCRIHFNACNKSCKKFFKKHPYGLYLLVISDYKDTKKKTYTYYPERKYKTIYHLIDEIKTDRLRRYIKKKFEGKKKKPKILKV